ncbi:hypothetical protein FRC14_008182, partial [Serendipita sp. 396]
MADRIKYDVAKTECVDVDLMLREFTRRIMVDTVGSNEDVHTLLSNIVTETRKMIQDALPEWKKGKAPRMENREWSMLEVLHNHKEFATCKTETASCRYWEILTNTALDLLRDRKLPGVRTYDTDINLILQHNDPSLLEYKHNHTTSNRNANSIFVPFRAALAIHGLPTNTEWRAVAEETTLIAATDKNQKKAPGGTIELDWGDALSSLEYKRSKSCARFDLETEKDRKKHDFRHILCSEKILSDPAIETENSEEEILVAEDEESDVSGEYVPAGTKRKRPNGEDSSLSRPSKQLKNLDGNRPRSSNPISGPSLAGIEGADAGQLPEFMSPPTRDATKSVAIQAAEYGMHRLVCSHDITHAFTIILENTVFYISWYDREGILTTSGIDIAYHLEYYLALLFILQRFNRTDWGRTGHPQLVTTPRANAGEKRSGMTRIEVEGKKFVFDTANPEALLHKSVAIRGRNTTVWEGQLVLENDEFSSEKYAIKFSWKEKTRKSEAEILRLITERAKGRRDILDYLPLVVASHVFSDVETGAIRAYMNVLEPKRAPRELVVTVTTKLKGRITELEPDDVWHVWWDCFKCHYKLWKLGIQHRDISTANIMYWEDAATGAKYGVLIDFDLAAIEGEASNNQQRTGTRPFLAMDFLRDDDGASVLHAYKHDVEAFCWVAVYVATCCESVDNKRQLTSNPPMLTWAYLDNWTLLVKKAAFL